LIRGVDDDIGACVVAKNCAPLCVKLFALDPGDLDTCHITSVDPGGANVHATLFDSSWFDFLDFDGGDDGGDDGSIDDGSDDPPPDDPPPDDPPPDDPPPDDGSTS
jgi:hypothetical protein